jgi:hypothetical protein
LNAAHRFGASKAKFFTEFGFSLDNWEVLAIVLKAHGAGNDVVKSRETGFGPRYEVEGPLNAPDGGDRLSVRFGSWKPIRMRPRLITAFPRR